MGPVTRRSSGFTLAEILVVLFVIGIAAALAYAQLDRDPRDTLEREGRRFAGALERVPRIAVELCVSERCGDADDEQHHENLGQRETAEPWRQGQAVRKRRAVVFHRLQVP